MIYLIGGGARCGKSTLARTLLSTLPEAAYVSGDSFRAALKPVLPTFHTSGVAADNPQAYIAYYRDNTAQAIDEAVRRAGLLWPFIARYISAYEHETGRGDLIIESVDIWPHLVHQLDTPHKAVFLVDTNPAQWQRVTSHAGENDWIAAKGLSPEQVKSWALYNAPRGARIIEECKEYGYEFEDIANQEFETAQLQALQKLL